MPISALAVHQLRDHVAFGSRAPARLARERQAHPATIQPFVLLCVRRDRSPDREAGGVVAPAYGWRPRSSACGRCAPTCSRDRPRPGAVRGPVRRRAPGRGGPRRRPRRLGRPARGAGDRRRARSHAPRRLAAGRGRWTPHREASPRPRPRPARRPPRGPPSRLCLVPTSAGITGSRAPPRALSPGCLHHRRGTSRLASAVPMSNTRTEPVDVDNINKHCRRRCSPRTTRSPRDKGISPSIRSVHCPARAYRKPDQAPAPWPLMA